MTAEQARTPASLRAAVTARQARRAVFAPARLLRRSLRVRTVAITLVLATVAIFAVGTVVSYTIAQGLFGNRLEQVLAESARATSAAQNVAVGYATDSTSLQNARFAALDSVQTAARPYGLYWARSDSSAGAAQIGDVELPENVKNLVSTQLRRALEKDGLQHWQSVSIPVAEGQVKPGIVVANTIQFGDGTVELYLVYDVADVQGTLTVVQRSLLIGGAALLLLIAMVTTAVVTLVVAPLRQAAAVSERLAAGHLEERIPEHGEDVVATLARSFNRMAESLQRQITQLANLSKVQQRFVSDVSHELRTPLTTIRLASDVLFNARERYDAPTARSAELLKTQVERFETLLADLLEISRMDARAAEVAGEPTNLVDLVREGVDALGGLAEETGTTIRVHTPGGHAFVDVDNRRIARIVRNLLANALEHGEGRPVDVTVDSSERAVAVGVRDHGIGMSQQDAERVFDRFWRADPSRQRRIGGTGLGLAISLEDAQLHGGALEVWTSGSDGTNFVLTLPRRSGSTELDRPVPLRPVDAVPERAVEPRHQETRVEVGS
ncbi:MtrAB system histidine kinase MtrB [Amnibacterium soli]|jgi:two-component system sensor histidine kinase MtrB|uniref:Sensor histidine kinase MtrB n=1 Tax=Amnibacterium soli TaxID=1282736 RepID=A0ABP8ZDG8_9MICO